MHIWTIEDWKNHINMERDGHRTGLRLRIDREVDPEVRRACKDFAKWLRKEYFFPMRIPVYIKDNPYIVAKDGEHVYGTFLGPFDYTVEPYIRIATGDYHERCLSWGKNSALTAILLSIAHELTHYFQWANKLQLTAIGEERQATRYARYILDEYSATRDNP